MLKIFNFFKSATGEPEFISMRQRFEAAQTEMNAVLSDMQEFPRVTIDAKNRKIEIETPEQFADEALALPAPDPVVQMDKPADEAAQEGQQDDLKMVEKAT